MNIRRACHFMCVLACCTAGAASAAEPAGTGISASAATLAGLRGQQRWPELKALASRNLVANPADADANAALVEALWHEGRAPEAVAAAERARARHADSPALRLALASAWSLLARWPDVVSTLSPDLDPATAGPDALLLAGIALREQGQYDAARVLLQALTRRYGGDRRGWVNLARLELLANRPAEALAAIGHLPADSAEALYLAARAQALNGQAPAAITTITKALAKAPQRASFYALRASLLANLQEWPAASRDIYTALQLGAWDAEDYLLACETARMLGDREALAAYARAGLSAHPRRVEFPLQLARALREQGKGQEALSLLAAARQAFPGNASLVLETAVSQSALGRDADVVATLTPLLEKQPLPQAYAMRAYARFRLGDLARADEDAANALALDPGQATALLVQARVALAQHQLPRAGSACQRALGKAPALAWAYTTCGEVALADARPDDARQLLERALLLAPQDAEALQLRERLRAGVRAPGDKP